MAERAIYRYEVRREGVIQMHRGARLLHVATKDGQPNVWAEVDVAAPLVGRRLLIMPTGPLYEVEQTGAYVGTFQLDCAGWVFVGHMFDLGEVEP